jgi:hypothetical protein
LDTSARSQVTLDMLPVTGTLVNLNRSSGQDCYQDEIEALSSWLMETLGHA